MKNNPEFDVNNLENLYFNIGAINTLMQIYFKLSINSAKNENQQYRRGINEDDLVSCIKYSPASFLEFFEIMSIVAGVKIPTAKLNISYNHNAIFSKFAEFNCKDNNGKINNKESQQLCEITKRIIINESNKNNININEIKAYSILLDTLCATYDYSESNVLMSAQNLKTFPYRYFEDGENVFTRHSFKRRPRIEIITAQNVKIKGIDKTLKEESQERVAEEENAIVSNKINYSGRVQILRLQTLLSQDVIKEMLKDVCYNLSNGLTMLDNYKNKIK